LYFKDRLRPIEALASSVPDDHPPPLSEDWKKEVRRRSEEIDADTVATEEWSTIRDRLFATHGIGNASLAPLFPRSA
jgi:hypothetical protein